MLPSFHTGILATVIITVRIATISITIVTVVSITFITSIITAVSV